MKSVEKLAMQYATRLFAQTEFLDQGAVAVGILALEVGEQALATIHHLDQAAAGVVILGVSLEVVVQFIDTRGQQCDLDFRRAGIVCTAGVVRNNGGFVDAFYRHVLPFTCGTRSRNPMYRERLIKYPGPMNQEAQYNGNAQAIQTLTTAKDSKKVCSIPGRIVLDMNVFQTHTS